MIVVFNSNSASDVKKTDIGGISSGGALALLRIMHCWHYDDSEIWPLSWGPFAPKEEKQTKNEDDDDIYPSTSNKDDTNNEPSEELEDDLSEKAPSRYVQKNHPKS